MYNTTVKNISHHHHPTTSSAAGAAVPYSTLHHRQFHHPIMIPLSQSSGGGDDEFPRRDERFPQWSNQESRDLIAIRAQFEAEFTAAKRNRNLWEMVANRMRDKGYRRTPDQCKCKWKNLVSRYKGQEASDVDNSRQCQFFNELHAVFTARAYQMQPPQLNAETGTTKVRKTLTVASEDQSHEAFSQEPEDEEEFEVEQAAKIRIPPQRKSAREKRQKTVENENYPIPSLTNANKNGGVLNSLQEMMRNFIEQQQRIDMHWRESMDKHAEEREMFEYEWRQKMEKLEKERMMMENAWREKEERRLREESRAERRDALLTTLLNKLIRDDNP